MLKTLRAAVALALLAPGVAFAQYSDSFTFLKAVREADGRKATDVLAKPGTVVIDTRDPGNGETALHIVAKRRDTQWLGFLLGKGANPNLRDGGGATPLMIAAQLGWADGIQLLLARRAQVDMANGLGETPLIKAVQLHDITSVKLLLLGGADPGRRDSASGLSAREYAVRDQRSAAILRAIDDARPRPKAAVGPN